MDEKNSNELDNQIPRNWQTWAHFRGESPAVSATGLSVFEWGLWRVPVNWSKVNVSDASVIGD